MRVRLTLLVACLLLVGGLAAGAQLLRSAAGGAPHGSLFPPAPSARPHPSPTPSAHPTPGPAEHRARG
jgi:hypothetical protein